MTTETRPPKKAGQKSKVSTNSSRSNVSERSSQRNQQKPQRRSSKQLAKGKKIGSDRAVLILSVVSIVSVVALAFTVGYVTMNGKKERAVEQIEVVAPVSVESIRTDVESFLFRRGVTLIGDNGGGTQNNTSSAQIELAGAADPYSIAQELERMLHGVSSDAWVDSNNLPERLGIYFQSTEVVSLLFPRLSENDTNNAVTTESTGLPKVAFVIDDIGRDIKAARLLLANEMELTFAILPNTENATRISRLVHESGREVFIHLPMEPQGYPEKNPGYDPLLVGASSDRIKYLLQAYRKKIPFAVGGNNHMGSRFTEDRRGMDEVLDYFVTEDLLFLDSLTSSKSVVVERANLLGVPVKKRDIFLDNVQDVQLIRAQIAKVVEIAERRGEAIAIGHPYPETIEALRLESEEGLQKRIQVVPVSTLF